MNLDQLKTSLISAARQQAPSDSVPLGFEHRVMSRVRAKAAGGVEAAADQLAEWTQGFWRAAVSSVGLCVLALAFHVSVPAPTQDWADSMEVLSADLDSGTAPGVELSPE
jgi:hypothetical protein